jgi:hypothetical protein
MSSDVDQQRDPEDRLIDESDQREKKDKMMDKTVADSFPASDPPSSLPDPDEDSLTLLPPDVLWTETHPFVTEEKRPPVYAHPR